MTLLQNLFHLPLSSEAYVQFQNLSATLQSLQLQQGNDAWTFIWGTNFFQSRKVYKHLIGHRYVHNAYKWLWKSSCQNKISELSLAQLVRFIVVEPAHPVSSPQLGTGARIFLDLFQDLRRCAFCGRRRSRWQRGACGDFINLEMCRHSLSEVLIGVGLHTYVHRGECACVLIVCNCTCVIHKKKQEKILLQVDPQRQA
jgi:hypothetical protein